MISLLGFIIAIHSLQIMVTVIGVIVDSKDFESRRSFVLCLLMPGYPVGKAVYREWCALGERDAKRREHEYAIRQCEKLRARECERDIETRGVNKKRINDD